MALLPRWRSLLCCVLVFSCAGTAQLVWAKKLPKEIHTKDANTTDPSYNNLMEGMGKMKKGDIDGAIDSFLQSTYFARNNYDPPAYYWLGMCYKAKRQDGKAIEAFKTHIQQQVTGAPDAHVELGQIYMRNDRDQEAEVEFNHALGEYRGPAPRAHNGMGMLLEKHGNLQDANWHFREALGDQPWTYAAAWVNYAENAMKQGDWGEATEQCVAMLARGATLPFLDRAKVHVDLGVCMLAKGNHGGALDQWQRACLINPLLSAPHLYLAKLLDSENHISSAIGEYRQYIALHPKDKNLDKVKDRLTYLEQQVKPAEAEVQAAKPSPYMRQQAQKEIEEQASAADKYKEEMESLSGGPQADQKDSGF